MTVLRLANALIRPELGYFSVNSQTSKSPSLRFFCGSKLISDARATLLQPFRCLPFVFGLKVFDFFFQVIHSKSIPLAHEYV